MGRKGLRMMTRAVDEVLEQLPRTGCSTGLVEATYKGQVFRQSRCWRGLHLPREPAGAGGGPPSRSPGPGTAGPSGPGRCVAGSAGRLVPCAAPVSEWGSASLGSPSPKQHPHLCPLCSPVFLTALLGDQKRRLVGADLPW